MKTDLTPKDVTPELIDAVGKYIVCRAIAEVVRKDVDGVQRAVLQKMTLMDDSRRIFNPDRVYLCEDQKVLHRYWTKVDKKLRAANFKPDDMEFDHCPALVAEQAQLQAGWAILDEAAKMLDIYEDSGSLNDTLLCQKDGLAMRRQFIDLTVGLVVSLK